MLQEGKGLASQEAIAMVQVKASKAGTNVVAVVLGQGRENRSKI